MRQKEFDISQKEVHCIMYNSVADPDLQLSGGGGGGGARSQKKTFFGPLNISLV